jgi:hypothetical protein
MVALSGSCCRSFCCLVVWTALSSICGVALTTSPAASSGPPMARPDKSVGERCRFMKSPHVFPSAFLLGFAITALNPVVADAAVATTTMTVTKTTMASDPAAHAMESLSLATLQRSAQFQTISAFEPSATVHQKWMEGTSAWNFRQSSHHQGAPDSFVLPSLSLSANDRQDDSNDANSAVAGGGNSRRRRRVSSAAPSQNPPNPAVVRIVGPIFWSYLGFSTLAGIKGVYDGIQRKRGNE